LKRAPRLDLAIIGRAWVDRRAGKLDDARKRLEAAYRPGGTSPALGHAYAQVLLAAGDPASRDKAKTVLEKAAGAGVLGDAARAALDYARVLRDRGDVRGARSAFDQANRAGIPEARFEAAQLEFEDRHPAEGSSAIEALVSEAGTQASAALL